MPVAKSWQAHERKVASVSLQAKMTMQSVSWSIGNPRGGTPAFGSIGSPASDRFSGLYAIVIFDFQSEYI